MFRLFKPQLTQIVSHSGVVVFECYFHSVCKFTNPDRLAVFEHLITNHRQHVCVKCGIMFNSRQEKKKHMQKEHSL